MANHLDVARPDTIALLLDRVRSEFLEMPGLRLTPAQAARLWALDATTSRLLLDALTRAGFLCENRDGLFFRASESSRL